VQDIVADSSLTVKQKKAATALVSSSLSGLYAEVKDQKTVDDVKKIVKDALSNEDVQKAIKTGRKQIDIPWKISGEPRVSGEIRKSLKGSTDSSGEWSLKSKRKG
jgi:flagellar biosynthesis regulator FlbT